jgi:hypothetical protein
MAASIFELLSKERPATKEKIRQPHRREDLRAFLLDILADGPMLVTRIIERGTTRGFTRKQILHGKERNTVKLNIIALKQTGTRRGKWMWALAPHTRTAFRAPSERATQ